MGLSYLELSEESFLDYYSGRCNSLRQNSSKLSNDGLGSGLILELLIYLLFIGEGGVGIF